MVRLASACLMLASASACGRSVPTETALAGEWIFFGVDTSASMTLAGESGGPITGTGTFHVYSGPGQTRPFTVSGTENELRFNYRDGYLDDFKYVRLNGSSLDLFFNSAPGAAGFSFRRP